MQTLPQTILNGLLIASLADCVGPDVTLDGRIVTPALEDEAVGSNPVLSYDEMTASLRRCEIAEVHYGGPVRVYYFTRKDGTSFVVRGTGNWLDAEEKLAQTVATETAKCDGDIMMVIS